MVYAMTLLGAIDVISYFDIDEETGAGILVDPGAEPEKLEGIIEERRFQIEAIFLTHGHFDHIGGVAEVAHFLAEKNPAKGPVPVYIHENGRKYLTDPAWNLSSQFGNQILLQDSDDLTLHAVQDGEEILLSSGKKYRVIHTPGHTTDSILYYNEAEGYAFSGDTIFRGSVGNDRFPGGDGRAPWQSIREKVFTLPEETVLLSGHSEPTTVAEEKRRYRRT